MTAVDAPLLVLTTGGTIDKQYFDALSAYQIADTTVRHILEKGRVTHPFRVEEVLRKDSLELSEADRALIRERVLAAPETRIVVTHGTDTMTDTARTLADIGGRTVVLVGALTPARFSDSDAPFNLGMAFACAQVAPPGVYIAMNGSIFDGTRVRKDRAQNAFVPL